MVLSMEQRLVMKFCFKAGQSATENLQMVNAAYGDQAQFRSDVFGWCGRFPDGREDIEQDPIAGLLSVATKTMSRRFLNCCFETVTCR